tara:strand:+ start:965 stop:1078 length:114 start_codon:yes stop_codon:yes gene_type:complete
MEHKQAGGFSVGTDSTIVVIVFALPNSKVHEVGEVVG